jgi:hypothetical protein
MLQGVYLKHSSLWHTADAKPLSNDLVQAILCRVCMQSLFLYCELYVYK